MTQENMHKYYLDMAIFPVRFTPRLFSCRMSSSLHQWEGWSGPAIVDVHQVPGDIPCRSVRVEGRDELGMLVLRPGDLRLGFPGVLEL